ncbi:unnamed protein product, partial [Nesidiocoris tenuis]
VGKSKMAPGEETVILKTIKGKMALKVLLVTASCIKFIIYYRYIIDILYLSSSGHWRLAKKAVRAKALGLHMFISTWTVPYDLSLLLRCPVALPHLRNHENACF